MGYIATLYTRHSSLGYLSGHTFIGITDNNGNEIRRGFTMKSLDFITGFNEGQIEDESVRASQVYDESRPYIITEEQYNNIKNEIENLEYLESEGVLNYDLLDQDRDLNDFNCVTFVEHLLNAGNIDGGNINLALIPHVVVDASYMNDFGKGFWDAVSWISGSDGMATIEYINGYLAIKNGGWDSHSTIPSSNITIDTSYDKLTNNLSISTSKEIDNKDFISGAIDLSSTIGTTKLTINEVQFDITQTNNLTIVNALDDIPAVSILLTHINIQVGEQLDLGTHGLYTVEGNDTLSEIAAGLNDGTTTKDLLRHMGSKLNS